MAGIVRKGKAYLIYFPVNKVRRYIYLPKGFTKREADTLANQIDRLKHCHEYGKSLPDDLSIYVSDLPPKLRLKIEKTGILGTPAPHTLKDLIDCYMRTKETSKNISKKTIVTNKYAVFYMKSYFGENKDIFSISTDDVEMYKEWLLNDRRLSVASTSLYLRISGQILRWGVKRGYLKVNPFNGIKRGSMVTKKKRHITMDEYRSLLAVCPNQSWRTLIALCRIGGLRNPSETFRVTWDDIDWKNDKLTVHSPKTEKMGKGIRVIPLFPELKQELEASRKLKTIDGLVLADLQNSSTLYQKFKSMMIKAGLTPWDRPFHNLRGSRDDDLFSNFTDHEASEWMGHNHDTAKKHYLKATDEQVKKASSFITE